MTEGHEKEELKEMPWWLRLALDVVMLRSTPLTAVIYTILWSSVVIHITWECGYLDQFGFPSHNQKVKQELAWLVSNDGRYFSGVLCKLPEGGWEAEHINEHIDRLQAEYQFLTGHEITLPPCKPR